PPDEPVLRLPFASPPLPAVSVQLPVVGVLPPVWPARRLPVASAQLPVSVRPAVSVRLRVAVRPPVEREPQPAAFRPPSARLLPSPSGPRDSRVPGPDFERFALNSRPGIPVPFERERRCRWGPSPQGLP